MSNQELYMNNRMLEVEEINAHSWDKIKSAHRRDNYYLRNLTDLPEEKPLTQEQLKEINDFWKPYEFAYKNDPLIQQVFYQQSEQFDPSYIGFGLQRHSLVRFWNHSSYEVYRNKFYLPLLFPMVKHPITYIANNHGVYQDRERNIISKSMAVSEILQLLDTEKELIAKPSDESGSGNGIEFLRFGMSAKEIENIFDRLKEDFICQKIIKNHPSYAAPHKESLNTLRIATLIWNNEVKLVGTVFRMGVSGRVDNWGQGGLVCAVDTEGVCAGYAVTEKGYRVNIHPSGFEFAGHKLYRCAEIQELACKLHTIIPQQKYISWDLTVDENGDIILVEMNTPGSSELLQAVGINAYINKNIAKEIFDEYLIRRFFVNKATFEWNYREFSNHVSLTEFAGVAFDEEIVIPSTISGKPVLMVYDTAFKKCLCIKKITIPKSILFNEKIFLRKFPDCTILKI